MLYLTFCANDVCKTITTGELLPLSLCQQEGDRKIERYEVNAECHEVRVSI